MRDQLYEVFGIPEDSPESQLNGEIVSILGEISEGGRPPCECERLCHEGVLISAFIDCPICGQQFNGVRMKRIRPINNPELDKVDQSINKIVEGVFA